MQWASIIACQLVPQDSAKSFLTFPMGTLPHILKDGTARTNFDMSIFFFEGAFFLAGFLGILWFRGTSGFC